MEQNVQSTAEAYKHDKFPQLWIGALYFDGHLTHTCTRRTKAEAIAAARAYGPQFVPGLFD